jgi:hypothetical protein
MLLRSILWFYAVAWLLAAYAQPGLLPFPG